MGHSLTRLRRPWTQAQSPNMTTARKYRVGLRDFADDTSEYAADEEALADARFEGWQRRQAALASTHDTSTDTPSA